MKHEIIKTDNYLLVVEETNVPKIGKWYYNSDNGNLFVIVNDYPIPKSDIVISHLPLNGSPILEGVDLLPPLGDEVEKMAFEKFSNKNPTSFATRAIWIDGYNQAKEKYKYTEEDLRKAMFLYSAWITGGTPSLRIAETAEERQEQIIQSLSQPKIPIGFECETETRVFDTYPKKRNINPKTTTTPEGHTQWVGKYIYE